MYEEFDVSAVLEEVNAILESGGDYYRAYEAIYPLLPEGSDIRFWFENAAIINLQAHGTQPPSNNNQASAYILFHSALGLRLDGLPINLATTSDHIAVGVLEYVKVSGGIISLEAMMLNEISIALKAGNQTIGGWGGAISFWDLPFEGDTVGNTILASGHEYEKFLQSAATATVAVLGQELNEELSLSEITNLFDTVIGSDVPLSVKRDIVGLVFNSIAFGEAVTDIGFFGDWIYDSVHDQFFYAGTGPAPTLSTEEEGFLRERLETRLNIHFQGLNLTEHAIDALSGYVYEGYSDETGPCFIAGTLIDMWDGAQKPIEQIEPGDQVTSYDERGKLVPGRVTRVFRKRATSVLDFFGTGITPSHAVLCGDGEFEGQHVPIIDVLRSDGALVLKDGTAIRASTGAEVSAPNDVMIWAITGDSVDSGTRVREKGQIRLGTRFITNDGHDVCIAELVAAGGGTVTDDGLVQLDPNGPKMPFHWKFTDALPKPEDYVLQRSNLKLSDIYRAGEWESIGPQMAPPDIEDVARAEDHPTEYAIETERGSAKLVVRTGRVMAS